MRITMFSIVKPLKENISLTNGKKDGVDLTGETNATLNIIDANTTLHDGNYLRSGE